MYFISYILLEFCYHLRDKCHLRVNVLFSFVECCPVKPGSPSLVFSLKGSQVIIVIIVTLALHHWSTDRDNSPCSVRWANPEPAPDVALVLFRAEQTDS